jgi:2-polyprenyl-3-methyl-5-hydroxy-6-metoxy-1,4-benzoquinol methylase
MKQLPPHLQMATQLHQQLQKWNAHMETLSILQQANVPQAEVDGARRAQEQLERLYQEHDFTERDLHNIFQKVTWDASADAKAARSITGDMPTEIRERVDRACGIVADAVSAAGKDGRCLDVGCGFGALVPSLVSAGVARSQIHGVDLSEEMIRNANELHAGCHFEAADFYQYEDADGFDAIILCASLHNLPDPVGAIKKAASLLRPSGTLVLVHPQGASHVAKQAQSNPILVKRGLPDASELRSLSEDVGLRLTGEPAPSNSPRETSQGYLAVLEK